MKDYAVVDMGTTPALLRTFVALPPNELWPVVKQSNSEKALVKDVLEKSAGLQN